MSGVSAEVATERPNLDDLTDKKMKIEIKKAKELYRDFESLLNEETAKQ